MFRMPSEKEISQIRVRYPAGTRIELLEMEDPFAHPNPGDRGTVVGVDDIGQIMMRWDKGSSLSLIPGVDQFKVVKE